MNTENLINFIVGGRAVFTVTSQRTGQRFTYKVTKVDTRPGSFFVSVLHGPDNTRDYTYMGMMRGADFKFWTTQGSRVTEEAPSMKGFRWLCAQLRDVKDFSEQAEVHHEGRCGRCGRALTVPESIESGFGPECITKVGS